MGDGRLSTGAADHGWRDRLITGALQFTADHMSAIQSVGAAARPNIATLELVRMPADAGLAGLMGHVPTLAAAA